MAFLPLHAYTEYSILKSGLFLVTYVSLAKQRGQSYCAITDLNSVTGYPEFTKRCAENGLKPIYGYDASYDGFSFTFVIESEEGYKNLISIGLACSKGTQDLAFFSAHQEGLLIVLDLGSPRLQDDLAAGNAALATTLAPIQRALPHLVLGLPYLPHKLGFAEKARDFIAVYPYPLIAFPLIRYPKPEDAIGEAIAEAIASQMNLEQKELSSDQWYLDDATLTSYYTQEELDLPERLVQDSTFVFEQKRGKLPHFPTQSGLDSVAELRRLVSEGLHRLVPHPSAEYLQRMEYELGVIERMGYCDYFLIVADYVNFAKAHGISLGPGRGSAAGSLVAFALGIVITDPLKYGLLFERFLNPERQSMPDIDIDVSDVRRGEVIRYLQKKYGYDRAGFIISLQTLGAKGSIRDVGKVFNFQMRPVNELAEAIGDSTESLRDNYRHNKAFRDLVNRDPYYLDIVRMASKVEGLPRQPSLHPAGIVISEEPLEHIVPIVDNPGTGLVAQYEMTYLEEQGVLKMDILSLRNLTIVDHCLDLIEATRGYRPTHEEIPYDDPKAIALIASGKTMGLFQLESAGMNNAIKTIKPTSFLDMVAIIALYRPGPMENIPSFAARKAGKEPIVYDSPLLESILSETYGIIVYQEQILQIVRALAGFSYASADSFRRAVSKKDAAKLESLRDSFLAGCKDNGVDEATASKVFALIDKFANYGFNKSHALVYAVLACQMAYLKAYYPLEFYCAILDETSPGSASFMPLSREMRSSGYGFALPSVEEPALRFVPLKDKAMFPLMAIKGLERQLSANLLEERRLHGPYKDIFDFALRNKAHGLTLKSFIRLIDAGALDCFHISRPRLRLAADGAFRYAEMLVGANGNQMLLDFDLPKPEIPMISDDRQGDLLAELEALGMMVSGSPLESKAEQIKAARLLPLSALPNATREEGYAALVGSVKTRLDKNGRKYAFVTLYDDIAAIDVAIFAETYDQAYPCLKKDTAVKAYIRRNYRKDGYIASRIEFL